MILQWPNVYFSFVHWKWSVVAYCHWCERANLHSRSHITYMEHWNRVGADKLSFRLYVPVPIFGFFSQSIRRKQLISVLFRLPSINRFIYLANTQIVSHLGNRTHCLITFDWFFLFVRSSSFSRSSHFHQKQNHSIVYCIYVAVFMMHESVCTSTKQIWIISRYGLR